MGQGLGQVSAFLLSASPNQVIGLVGRGGGGEAELTWRKANDQGQETWGTV